MADAEEREVVILVDRALRKMAAWHGSADVAVTGLLCDLAMLVQGSWSVDHARKVEKKQSGETRMRLIDDVGPPVSAFDEDADREAFLLHVRLLEGHGVADGIVYQDVATRLLEPRAFQQVWCAVSYVGHLVDYPLTVTSPRYEAFASEYLRGCYGLKTPLILVRLADSTSGLFCSQPCFGDGPDRPFIGERRPPLQSGDWGHSNKNVVFSGVWVHNSLYPFVAQYRGSGDIVDAGSYTRGEPLAAVTIAAQAGAEFFQSYTAAQR